MTSPNNLIVSTVMVGTSFVLTSSNTSNIAEVLAAYSVNSSCPVSVAYDGVTYPGNSVRIADEIIVTFDEEVSLPSGMCIIFNCVEEVEPSRDCKNTEILYDPDMKLAVLDDDGCLKGWIRAKDLLSHVTVDIPTSLCELYGVDTVPEGHLTASDKILTVSQDCSIKAIPASDIVCD